MTFEALLAKYQQVIAITGKMLVMAEKSDWENLLNFQAEYDLAVQFLLEIEMRDIENQFTSKQQSIIRTQITEILNNQNQLQKLVDLHRFEIGELIGEKVNSRAQINSYNKIAKLV